MYALIAVTAIFATIGVAYIFVPSKKKCIQTSRNGKTISSTRTKSNNLIHTFTTLSDVFKHATMRFYPGADVLGERTVEECDKIESNGKTFIKQTRSEYNWYDRDDIVSVVDSISSCLKDHGRSTAAIFAETSRDWFLYAWHAFLSGRPLVTIYPNLGIDAVCSAVNETEATSILIDTSHIPLLKNLVDQQKIPTINTVIFTGHDDDLYENGVYSNVVFRSLNSMRSVDEFEFPEVQPSDTAVIMYTSGSTGAPKGVVLTHENIVETLKGTTEHFQITEEDVYISYLPLAHILGLVADLSVFVSGGKIGYSNPKTLVDGAPMLKTGVTGDVKELRPTLMSAVPLVLNRIKGSIEKKVAASGRGKDMFNWGYNYVKNGGSNPIIRTFLNTFVFSKIRAVTGGRVRLMLSGGAPLHPDTHEFIKICFGCDVLQGYGLTETTGAATALDPSSNGNAGVGCPIGKVDVRLVDWEEGGYTGESGEVWISGPSVCSGYYKRPEKNAEDFVTEDGVRWFKTGDIGTFDEDNNLHIIDRKKNIVKLEHGEYVSISKVESKILESELVSNVCVHADSSHSWCVAIVVPNIAQIKSLISDPSDEQIQELVTKELTGLVKALPGIERPKKFIVVNDEWTPDNGMLTPSLKLKPSSIYKRYSTNLEAAYA